MVIERSPSNRVKSLLVVGERGSTILKGNSVRSLLNLPGTNFNISYEGSSYVLEGQGFGHGLGMSQWGARTLAEHGYNADQILKYYYRDVTFGQIFERTQL
ncbi:MAG TPA: sporulation protein, partial [Candidatus Melainabacteria bacterium]|nr:sporulation protein [Candidatus Melainabacteria bacterium]